MLTLRHLRRELDPRPFPPVPVQGRTVRGNRPVRPGSRNAARSRNRRRARGLRVWEGGHRLPRLISGSRAAHSLVRCGPHSRRRLRPHWRSSDAFAQHESQHRDHCGTPQNGKKLRAQTHPSEHPSRQLKLMVADRSALSTENVIVNRPPVPPSSPGLPATSRP